ncbi:xylulokinase [Aurantimonas sp. Leaf443]|uniref:xylulokinase n=1 Tax=Aurantimonas sp. Leaf443 TaxID=1736378 RepID=UPI0006F5DA22|nr:xylulokinase [Aurantimonas sp. Leaf443]KQT85313.1 xylulose kinase [Aurantimonas sp. Leaf443]
MPVTLGLDLGTSSLKALVVGEDGVPVASASAPLSVERPQFGWSEQAPDDWIAATRTVMAELAAAHPGLLSTVSAIGLSGQMHGATVLGADERPLRPCILWNDTRAHAEAAELDDAAARAITGNIVFPGFTAPKLLWLARHESATFARVCRVLLPKDYLRLWLTGEAISDLSDAAGTSWLDTGARDWSDEMLARTGLDRTAMPRLVEGSAPGGRLRAEVAAELGLAPGIVVAGGAGDNAASACGVGIVRPGAGFLSLGTSGVLFTATRSYEPVPQTALHTFCHAVPGLWHHMGVTLSAAGSLDWLSKLLQEGPAELVARLGDRPRAPRRLLFLPYLSGERTPHNDAAVRGTLLGLEADTDRADMARAVLEGVAFSLRDCLEAGGAGERPDELIAVGAGSRSDHWLSLIATVLGIALVRPAAGDFGAALGAARLALCAETGADPASVMTRPPLAARFEPDASLRGAFEGAYGRYRALYPMVRPSFR